MENIASWELMHCGQMFTICLSVCFSRFLIITLPVSCRTKLGMYPGHLRSPGFALFRSVTKDVNKAQSKYVFILFALQRNRAALYLIRRRHNRVCKYSAYWVHLNPFFLFVSLCKSWIELLYLNRQKRSVLCSRLKAISTGELYLWFLYY